MSYAVGSLLILHIASIAVALGAIASGPLVLRGVAREAPGSVPALLRAQRRLGDAVVAPSATLTLLTGAALATLGGYWDELWVSLPLSLLVFVLSLHGAFVSPTERRLEALATQLEYSARAGELALSKRFEAVARRLTLARYASAGAILLAMVLMVLKP